MLLLVRSDVSNPTSLQVESQTLFTVQENRIEVHTLMFCSKDITKLRKVTVKKVREPGSPQITIRPMSVKDPTFINPTLGQTKQYGKVKVGL